MKVFITVTGERSEGSSIDRVYLQRRLAMARKAELIRNWEAFTLEEYDPQTSIDLFFVQEHLVI